MMIIIIINSSSSSIYGTEMVSRNLGKKVH